MKRQVRLLVLAVAALLPCISLAGTASASFQITVSVLASCSVTTSDLALEYVSGARATRTVSPGSIEVRCSKGTPAQVFVDGPRTLIGPDGSTLTVALSEGGQAWPEGQGVAVMGEGQTTLKLPVGATVVAGQRVAPGDYVGEELVRVVY